MQHKLRIYIVQNCVDEEAYNKGSNTSKIDSPKRQNSPDSFKQQEDANFQDADEAKETFGSDSLPKPSSSDNTKTVTLNEKLIKERQEIISNTKSHILKTNELPPTTLDYYKFVRCIGKGAFGKVTLGIHKLTGKYVAIKTIDKRLIKDEFSKRKVFKEVYILK